MISAFITASLLCGGAIGQLAPAEKLQVSASIMAGSGMSLAGVGGRTYGARSPAFLLGEVALAHPQLQWLEFAPALAFEVEGRVGVGLIPKIRARLGGKRVRVWGLLGLPVFFAPYSLVGVQGGAGLSLALHPRFALVAEFTGTGFVWGSDLMSGSALAKLDQHFGIRVNF